MEQITINGKPVDHFISQNPYSVAELQDTLEGIFNRLTKKNGSYKKSLIYAFTEDELDVLGSATDWLMECPVFEKESKPTLAGSLTDTELRAVLCLVANAMLAVKRGDFDDQGVSDRGEPCVAIDVHLEKRVYEDAVRAYKKVKHLI